MRLHWHRRDLRGPDNVGVAAGDGHVLAVFVLDESVLAHAGPPRVAFLLDALADLRRWYRERGADLVVRRGDPVSVLATLATATGADGVSWNRDYTGLARDRDETVAGALDDAGVAHEQYRDAVLYEPGEITTNAGDPYAVFSYYGRKWREREKDDPVAPPSEDRLTAPEDADRLADVVDPGPLPALGDLGVPPPDATIPDAGVGAARERLDAFCEGPIYAYAEDRDHPAAEGTSRLSADLSFGTVGIREVYAATEAAMADAPGDVARDAVGEFRDQLAWREFYVQVLAANPETVTENYREFENAIAWREDPEGLAAWKAGETGYPIVDAGMRQLLAEAWMHNRLRMVVASFLTKDLLVDWREGYAHFREHLVDHDTAADVGGWQWAASTGTDAQPYFRIFNPMTQGERHDPDAAYIREHVPELREVSTEAIHGWDELAADRRAALAPGYPAPIVDHAERREAALAMFEAARGEE